MCTGPGSRLHWRSDKRLGLVFSVTDDLLKHWDLADLRGGQAHVVGLGPIGVGSERCRRPWPLGHVEPAGRFAWAGDRLL
jgi:hypothetical protein